MNRDRLACRKSMREIAYVIATLAGVLVLFDWLLWPLLVPHGLWWLSVAGDVAGVILFLASRAIFARVRRMGRSEARASDIRP
jgi:hypothetical protein